MHRTALTAVALVIGGLRLEITGTEATDVAVTVGYVLASASR